jgi:hypothetical protein
MVPNQSKMFPETATWEAAVEALPVNMTPL